MAKNHTTASKAKATPRKTASSKRVVQKASQVQSRRPYGFMIIIGILFIMAGGLVGYQPIKDRFFRPRAFAATPTTAPQQTPEVKAATKTVEKIEGKPVRLVIESLGIDLSIAEGTYNSSSKTWTLSNDKAHYATMTPLANNQGGNTFIYGHNRKAVFAKLPKMAVGAEAKVYTDNNHIFTYVFRSAYETDPYDDSLFAYQGQPIMTLQTCTGLWYQNRFLMTFDLVKVD